MCAALAIYELMIACVLVADAGAMPANSGFAGFNTEDSFGFNPTSGYRGSSDRDSLENIDVKELLEKLNRLQTKSPAASKTTSHQPPAVISAVHGLDCSKDGTNGAISSNKNVAAADLTILDNAYAKVSDHINLVHTAIQKNFDVMMKLNILKGMLMEENVRSKSSEPWTKFMSQYKNLYQKKY